MIDLVVAMDISQEIDEHARPADREALRWLFSRYHFEAQWHFVAECTHKRYGGQSYQTHRVWKPTPAGRIIYHDRKLLEEFEDQADPGRDPSRCRHDSEGPMVEYDDGRATSSSCSKCGSLYIDRARFGSQDGKLP